MKQHLVKNVAETKSLAGKIAAKLKGGETIGLIGELGAGKTVFVQGLAEGLGIKETVNSPTFVLMKVYSIIKSEAGSRKPDSRLTTSHLRNLIHVDCYRLNDSQELKDIGLEEYLNRKDTVVVIEWADKVKEILPPDAMIINFKEGENENQRIIELNPNI